MKRVIAATLGLALLNGAMACSDSPAGARDDDSTASAPDETKSASTTIIVSNASPPIANFNATSGDGSRATSASAFAYVSAAPGAFPHATSAVVRNNMRADVAPLTVAIVAAGFDPVAIRAESGDELSVTLNGEGPITPVMIKVPPRRPPTVVRTSPSRGRTDVALNVQVTVVFSEPVEPSVLTLSSIHLLHDGHAVNGHVELSPNGLTAQFVSDAPFEGQTTYSLVVDAGIRDLTGDVLSEASVVSFTTSTAIDPPAPVDQLGSLEVKIATSGVEADTDGYELVISAENGTGSSARSVSSNTTAVISALTAGNYIITLSGVNANCDIASPAPHRSAVTNAGVTKIDIDIQCAEPLQLTYEMGGGWDYDSPPRLFWTVSSNGKNAKPLTTGGTWLSDPDWSPDGTRMAYESAEGAAFAIQIMDASGNVAALATGLGSSFGPRWSPDGRRIVFSSNASGKHELFTVGVDGRDLVHVTAGTPGDLQADWSPDGKTLVFASMRDGIWGIWRVNIDGSGLTRLTSNSGGEGAEDNSPAWSPDGSTIAFHRWGPGQGIYTMNADGSNLTRLPIDATVTGSLDWSPEGRKIAFTASVCHEGKCEDGIRIVGIDGTRYTPIIIEGVVGDVAWRPRP